MQTRFSQTVHPPDLETGASGGLIDMAAGLRRSFRSRRLPECPVFVQGSYLGHYAACANLCMGRSAIGGPRS